MTYQQFLETQQAFDAGEVPFNHGIEIDAFLYNNKWYPVRAFVNHLFPDTNNHASIKMIVSVIPYIRIEQDIDFQNANGFPIEISPERRTEELRLLVQRMNDLIFS